MRYFIWEEWQAISKFYGKKKAKRSKVPLINHIIEGLRIMDVLGASENSMRAFCLHPLFQADAEFITVGREFALSYINAEVMMYVMEYRHQANAWLSDKVTLVTLNGSNGNTINDWLELEGKPSAGPVLEVRDMLIADKVQNRKDFAQYHQATHKRTKQLDLYFRLWLAELGISEEQYNTLCNN